jgi:hypothetical protein
LIIQGLIANLEILMMIQSDLVGKKSMAITTFKDVSNKHLGRFFLLSLHSCSSDINFFPINLNGKIY